jgi:methionyl aminopeptidase
MNFPKSVCTSVNEVLCHGIPDLRPLEDGDIINIDITLYKNGFHGDNSVMVKLGNVKPEIEKLINVT